jgi:hypothetical protein
MKLTDMQREVLACDVVDQITERIESHSAGLLTENQWDDVALYLQPEIASLLDHDFPDHIPPRR